MLHDSRLTNIKKQKFSFTFLRELCNKYYVSEWTEFEYCCRHEDYNCWIEVHSSWMRYKSSDPDKEYNDRVYKSIKGIVNSHLNKKQIGKRSMYVADGKNSIVVCIPMRDVSKSDQWLVFDKSHLMVE